MKREEATLDELRSTIEWHDSVAGGLEAVRRLRELVLLLDEIRNVSTNSAQVQILSLQAVTLAKGRPT